MAAPPETKLATIWAVTSWGQGVTPSATTPWSAANTTTAAGAGTGGGQTPAMPASCTLRSSSRPSDPRGLVSRSCRARASAIAAASSGATAAAANSKGVVTGRTLSGRRWATFSPHGSR